MGFVLHKDEALFFFLVFWMWFGEKINFDHLPRNLDPDLFWSLAKIGKNK